MTLDQIGAPVRRHLSIAITLCALLQGCTASEPQHAFPNNSDLELMLRFLVEDGEARDIVLGVLESDGSTRIVSFGGATEGSLPLDGESSFEIGSLTKVFTTTVLAEMAERGEVALDDPVSTYLPSEAHVPTFGDRPITLEDLATHTSGLSDATMLEQLPALGVVDPFSVTVETMYALLSNYSLQRKPGDAFEYSNFGMGLLGHALAQAAGMDLPSLVKERILDPLGMSDTHYGLEGTPAERLVQGYYGDQAAAPIVASEALEGAGGLRSTAADMLRFLAANVRAPDTDLTRAMQDAQVPRRPMGAGNRRVGLGWWTYTLNRRPLIQHDGDTDGFTARMAFDPARRIGMVLSTNSREFDNSLVPDLLVHDPIAPPEKEGVPVADLTGLTGTYLIDFIPWYVRLDEGGFLTVQPTTDVRMRLYAASDTLFFTKREEWSFAFPTDTVGESPDLVMYVNGRPHSGIRIDAESPPARTIAGNLGLPLDRAMAARYEGTYDVPVGSQTLELTIYWAESTGRLMTNFAGTVSRLIPMGADAFTVVYNPSIRVAFTLRDGRAEEVTLSQGGRSDSGVRRK